MRAFDFNESRLASRQEFVAVARRAKLLPRLRRNFKRLAAVSLASRVHLYGAMDPLTATAASGLRARMESLELLANNVANAGTGGYKADREFYGIYAAAESDDGRTMPLIERPWTDFGQGVIRTTGNQLDLALSGSGFFAVNGPSGPLYTRNGAFRVAADGKVATPEGYAVRTVGGAPLTIDPSRSVDITADGAVRQDGAVIGQLEIAGLSSDSIAKQGNNFFRAVDPAASVPAASSASVEQGKLETSNAGGAESAVRLVSVMRQYEMLQKAVALGGEMNRAAIEQVARVGS